jgi:hypothetical protein
MILSTLVENNQQIISAEVKFSVIYVSMFSLAPVPSQDKKRKWVISFRHYHWMQHLLAEIKRVPHPTLVPCLAPLFLSLVDTDSHFRGAYCDCPNDGDSKFL